MTDRNQVFEQCCLKEFKYLRELGFTLVKSVNDNYGCFLTYNNAWVGLEVSLAGSGINVNFYKLKAGEFPPYPIFFQPTQDLLVFNAVDLLAVTTDARFEQDTARLYEEDYLKGKVKELAAILRRHANDVFQGDFSVLPMIKQRMAKRASAPTVTVYEPTKKSG